MNNYQSKPLSENWKNQISQKIHDGEYKIPRFQREFVWSLENSAKLVDSVIKGYPVGTFVLWKTKERFASVKQLGNHELPEPNEGSEIYYIIDGQQRITTLYSAFEGLKISKEGKKGSKKDEIDFTKLYIDLEIDIEEENFVKILKNEQILNDLQIPIHVIAKGKKEYSDIYVRTYDLDTKLNTNLCEKLYEINQQLQVSYSYSLINIENTPIEVATDIFTRINTEGKKLTSFEIMCAKTYIEKTDTDEGFDLCTEFEDLITQLKELEFETISSAVVLQLMSAIITERVDNKSILSISRWDFRNRWDDCKKAIYKTVNFFRENLGVTASRILPYDGLIIPFGYYFSKFKDTPTGHSKSYLETVFWHTSLSEAYSGSSANEIEKDIHRVKEILNSRKPDFTYNTKAKLIDEEKVRKSGDFIPTKSFCKAILCCLNLRNPQNIFNGSGLRLENDYLVRSDSKQYHHFFPKAYLSERKSSFIKEYKNNIANIIFLDAQSNQKIGKKSPDQYLEDCQKNINNNHKSFEDVLASNLLPSYYTDPDGIYYNEIYLDFDRFIEWRIGAIVEMVRSTIKILD